MARTVFIKAEEVAQELEISKALAYRMIHRDRKSTRLYSSH